jgi:serine/threonine protein kinase
MVLFEMLALEPPYFELSPFQATQHILDGVRPVLPQLTSQDAAYQSLIQLFECCTELEPTKRPTAVQVIEMLWEL